MNRGRMRLELRGIGLGLTSDELEGLGDALIVGHFGGFFILV